ncbi:MAG TPA: nitroreductase family protein [Candidatus Woesearchaeota archaeon]|nr:nitroreductase family protein [Candidatus Woesearchaeota archaeon]
MDALECISTRRSIRRFLNVPVDFETIMTIVEAGSLAPSSGNVQDWKFIVVDNKDLMKKISEHSLGQECVHNAAFLIVVCSDPEQTEIHYGLRGQRLYTVQNCAAAAENMLLAAHALGLGGVWVGAFDEEKIRELLDIPKKARPQAILAFGYPDEVPDYKRVKDLRTITYFNSYGASIKKIHRVLRDYSVDWEARIRQAHTTIGRLRENAQKATQKAGKKMGEKGGSLFQKYKEVFNKGRGLRRKKHRN